MQYIIMKPICFIAARGGSKGVKDKNIKKLGGKPLIAYTIESAKKSKIFSHIIVSTEDKLIAKIAKRFGAEVPFQRPKNLATDDASFGIAGNVVDALQNIFPNGNHPSGCKIYSCGPPMMMEGVRSYALQHHLDCDLALETIMACGVGICQGCTVERKTSKELGHSYRNRFSLACMDGPIYNAKEIVSCM